MDLTSPKRKHSVIVRTGIEDCSCLSVLFFVLFFTLSFSAFDFRWPQHNQELIGRENGWMASGAAGPFCLLAVDDRHMEATWCWGTNGQSTFRRRKSRHKKHLHPYHLGPTYPWLGGDSAYGTGGPASKPKDNTFPQDWRPRICSPLRLAGTLRAVGYVERYKREDERSDAGRIQADPLTKGFGFCPMNIVIYF